jgi:glycosyltransferase involved in cell wall biosynthesis
VYREVPTIAVSESTREDLVLRGLDPAHIEVVPNGIDLERHVPGREEERFEEPTLVFLGRLNRYKRLDLVLRALVRLEHEGVRARLLVAGSGPERSAWEEQAAALGVAERVDFLGFVPEDRKLELLRRSWVHVLTSVKEGWGISNLEAGACGTPTVASDVPGLRESVVDGETGVLVPHGDVAALSAALAALLTDVALRRRMGSAARRFAEQYSWEATADGVERALDRVVARPPLG